MTENMVDVGKVGDIADGEGLMVPKDQLGTTDDVGVFLDGDEYFAIDNTCTHEKADLTEGWVEHCVVECPLHAAKFDLRTGAVLSAPATVSVNSHQVTIVGDRIMLTVNPASLAGS